MIRQCVGGALCLAVVSSAANAAIVDVVGGQTSVLLDTGLLSSAASLDLSGVSDDVMDGNLGEGSVAFGINPRDAMDPALPTTFSYDSETLAPFSGTIEHTGSVFFNDDAIEVGNFTIGYDEGRIDGVEGASGFFVRSNVGIAAILFDLADLDPTFSETDLMIGANLLVSPEFGGFLLDNMLSETNLQGADVGDAMVKAMSVPAPGALALFFAAAGLRRRRRN